MAVKLHRCSNEWVKISIHPCWRVQKALDDTGVEYVLVLGPWMPGKRDAIERLSGQRKYPVIEFEDGSVYREESSAMAARIKDGRLMEADVPGTPVVAEAPAAADGPAAPAGPDAPSAPEAEAASPPAEPAPSEAGPSEPPAG